MTVLTSLLPEGFDALEPYAESWAVASAAGRAQRRLLSTESERVAFYDAAKELVQRALTQLDQKPLMQLDEREHRLMNLMLGFAHVALAVEVQRDDEPRHAEVRKHMRIVRASADIGA
ncbi:MAG: hypothetical protein WC809_08955 [Sinimarinibacterium sp.]